MPPPRKRASDGSNAKGWMGSAQEGQPTTSHGGVNATIGASDQTNFRSVQLMVMSKQTRKLIPLQFDEDKGGLLAVPPTLAHSSLTGLTADDHLQYALLAGRAGGQTLRGDTSTSGFLKLRGGSGNAGYLDVDRLSLFDFAADPSTAGMLQRNNSKALFHDGTAARRFTLYTNVDPTNAQILVHNGTIWQPVSLSGDLTINNAGAVTLATVPATKGGTGLTGFTVGDLLQASTTTALAVLNAVATGNVLISGGVGVVSSWGKVGLTTHVTGTLGLTNGGLGLTGGTSGGILYFSGAAALASSAALTANALVIGGGAGVAPSTLAAMTDGQVLVGKTGSPPQLVSLGGDVGSVSNTGALILSKVNGNTFPASFATGDLPYGSGASAISKLAIGANGLTTLRVSGGLPAWGNVLGYLAKTDTAYSIVAADNGKLIDCLALTANRILTLPAAANLTAGWFIWVRKGDSSAFTITVTQAAAETINGATSNVLNNQDAYVGLMFDGTNYVVIGCDDFLKSNISTPANAGLSTQYANLTSLSITPGQWELQGNFNCKLNGATISGNCFAAISANSGNATGDHVTGDNQIGVMQPTTNQDSPGFIRWKIRITVAAPYYLKIGQTFSAGTPQMYGTLTARRIG